MPMSDRKVEIQANRLVAEARLCAGSDLEKAIKLIRGMKVKTDGEKAAREQAVKILRQEVGFGHVGAAKVLSSNQIMSVIGDKYGVPRIALDARLESLVNQEPRLRAAIKTLLEAVEANDPKRYEGFNS